MQQTQASYAFFDLPKSPRPAYLPRTTKSQTAQSSGSPVQSIGKMTTIDTTRSVTAGVSGIATAVSRLVATLTDWNDARITRKSLSRLSARELDDIGLNRGDIDLIAARGSRF